MLAHSRCFSFVLGVAILGFATTAQAGAKMYSGTLLFHAFGNTISQTKTPGGMAETRVEFFKSYFYGQPLGAFCNYGNLTHYVSMGMLYTGNLFISTAYPRPREAQATKICETIPTNQYGVPITGTNVAITTRPYGTPATQPPAFKIPGAMTTMNPYTTPYFGQMRTMTTFLDGVGGTVSGSFNYTYPYIYSITYATLGTPMGTFFAGGGLKNTADGGRVIPSNCGTATGYYPAPTPTADCLTRDTPPGAGIFGYVRMIPGENRFGGTARLLGAWRSFGFFYSQGAGYFGTFPWPFPAAGTYTTGTQCPNVAGMVDYANCKSVYRATNTATDGYRMKAYDVMGDPLQTFSYIFATGFPWTTGRVFVSVRSPALLTILTRQGYDNRTSMGSYGVIQLVTPHITNWVGQTLQTQTGHVAFMRLEFAPEARSWLLLGSGMALLGLLFRRRARKR